MRRFLRWLRAPHIDVQDLTTCEGYLTVDAFQRFDEACGRQRAPIVHPGGVDALESTSASVAYAEGQADRGLDRAA